LLAAFSKALHKAPKASMPHQIEREPVTIEDQAAYILAIFQHRTEITFAELVRDSDRSMMLVTFLAILEMMRNRDIVLRQPVQFGEIMLYRTAPEGEVLEEGFDENAEELSLLPVTSEEVA
jgi:segregation and condensation protein A